MTNSPSNPPHRILLVDDDQHLLQSLGSWLKDQGFDVQLAADKASAEKALSSKTFDLAFVDLRLGDEDGMDILSHCRKHHPNVVVILMTGYATVDTGVEAIRAGAFDLMTKPLIDDEILIAINRALSQQQVLEENEQLKAQLDKRFAKELSLIHISEPTRPRLISYAVFCLKKKK